MSRSGPVSLVATGGTIASHFDGGEWINVDGATLLADVAKRWPDVAADVVVDDVATGSSSNLSTAGMVAVAQRIDNMLTAGARGVVVSHGTDTIELTAFVAQLLLGVDGERAPVVFTGSMRVHSDPDPDGPRNLGDALRAANDPAAVGREVLVAYAGQLHAADRIRKIDARSLDAFTSAPFEPVGTVDEDGVHFDRPPAHRPKAVDLVGDVAIVSCYPGITGDDLTRAAIGRDAVVVEAFGDLNAPMALWEPIHRLSEAGMPVVLSSTTYTDRLDDDDLAALGAIGCGGLTSQRARLATMAALSLSPTPEGVKRFLADVAVLHDAGERSSRPEGITR